MTTIKYAFYAAIVSFTMSCSSGGSEDPAASGEPGNASGAGSAIGTTGLEGNVPSNDSEELPASVTGLWRSQDELYLELTAPLTAEIWRESSVENCFNYLKSSLTVAEGGQYRDDQNTGIELVPSADGNFLDFTTFPSSTNESTTIRLARVVGISSVDLFVCVN